MGLFSILGHSSHIASNIPELSVSSFIAWKLLLVFMRPVKVYVSFICRSLRCTRIRIHVQLFISLALSCFAWIIWYNFVVESPEVIQNNSVKEMWVNEINFTFNLSSIPQKFCVLLHLVLHYLMLVNYLWMFCEGLHLHLVLVVVRKFNFIKLYAFKMFLLSKTRYNSILIKYLRILNDVVPEITALRLIERKYY